VRWVGGLGLLALLAVIFHGLWQGAGRPAGYSAGRFPGWLRSPIYYLFSLIIFFGGCALLWQPIPLSWPDSARAAALLFGSVSFWPGLGLAMWGRLTLGRMYFVSTALGAHLFAGHQLVMQGPYAIVRHPMYVGLTATVLGGLLIYRTWTWVLLLVLPIVLGLRARREEQALRAQFGAAWQAYCRRVPAFVPRWRPPSP
ncbi:MAG: isoprenylcysteine carboxylmethyltransferase family protein, partial [Anaerolineales bacterium]|nr:isoprenylcysteine carboxylmethyltransferase family protein [Anaerolineales bacterium]